MSLSVNNSSPINTREYLCLDWPLLLTVTFFAATVQSATGFGFGLIAVSAFLVVLNSIAAVQLVIIITCVMLAVHSFRLWNVAVKSLLRSLSIGCALGFPLGILAYKQFDMTTIKLTVAILLIALSSQNAWLLFRHRKSIKNIGHKPTQGSTLAVGIISGLMASSIAMPGPPVMLYLVNSNLTKDQVRATVQTFFLVSYVGALLLQTTLVGIDIDIWITAAILLPSALLGLNTGYYLSKRINQQFFKGLVLVILMLTGLFMLVNLNFQ